MESIADKKDEHGIMSLLGNIGERTIDALAERGGLPGAILGGGILQPVFNTEGYREDQASIALKEMYKREHEADAPIREMKRTEFIQNAPIRAQENKEYMDSAPTRKLQDNALAAQARLAESNVETDFKNKEYTTINENNRKRLSADPGFAMCTIDEKNAILSSPKMQALTDMNYYTRQGMKAKFDGDEKSWKRIVGDIEAHGGKVSQDDKGEYVMTLNGRNIKLNEESFVQLNKQIESAAQEETQVRQMLSAGFNSGNPSGQEFAKRVTDIMPYMKNDAVAASGYVKKFYAELPERERIYLALNRVLDNYYDSTVSGEEKMKGFEQGMMLAKRMGLSVDAPDGNPETARILDPANKRSYNLAEFRDFVKTQNVAGNVLDQQLATYKATFEQKEKQEKLKTMGGSFGEERNPMAETDKLIEKSAEESFKAAPKLSGIIGKQVQRYNQNNPKKQIDQAEVKNIVGAAHYSAMQEADGDPEEYKKLFVVKMNNEFSDYGIKINGDADLGFDEKTDKFKLDENAKKRSGNEKRISELDEEIGSLKEKHKDKFSKLGKTARAGKPRYPLANAMAMTGQMDAMSYPQATQYTSEEEDLKQETGISPLEEKKGILLGRNTAIDADTVRRKKRQAQRVEDEKKLRLAGEKSAEKKKTLNSLLGI